MLTENLPNLNIPYQLIQFREVESNLEIFDIFRKKWVNLTPEEWVRQQIALYFHLEKGYSKSLIKIEGSILYNNRKKRFDICIYEQNGEPYLLIECKAAHIVLKQQTLTQILSYYQSIKAKYLLISNGLEHIYYNLTKPDNGVKIYL